MGLLADDSEWMRCLQDVFSATFEPLTTVFATIISHCEPPNPLLWERNSSSILTDLRKRYAAIPEALKLLENDKDALQNALQEVESVLKDINVRFSLATAFATPPPKVD